MMDLVVLVPDRNIESSILGILTRTASLEIRPVNSKVFLHVQRDPGCFGRAHDFLAPHRMQFRHALVVFDRIGSGCESQSREEIEQAVEYRLARSGWGSEARCIVIDPEVETWVWSDSPHVADVLGWQGPTTSLRDWLVADGLWQREQLKPQDPKRAMEAVLRRVGQPRSSALYLRLARSVGLTRCTDPAFTKLRAVLREWFASGPAPSGSSL